MKELKKFITDSRFYIPVVFLIGFELFLQSGLYKYLLQPRSYAENFNRIIRIAGHSTLRPNLLILGTSVAYQGILVKRLNGKIQKKGLIAQSAACEGAKLITQRTLYKVLKPRLKGIKTLVHISEISFPWTATHILDEPNRSMIAQAPRRLVFPLLKRNEFTLRSKDYFYFIFRTLTYQRDLRDFVLDPLDRFKGIGRRMREKPTDYVYENHYTYKISSYSMKSLDECIRSAIRGIPNTVQSKKCIQNKSGVCISDKHHREAVLKTCRMGLIDPINTPGRHYKAELYFRRMWNFYSELRKRNIRIIIVFPPYSNLIRNFNADARVMVWRKKLKELSPENSVPIIDLRHSLDGPNNGDYYYDTIHLNRYGAERFTDILAKELLQIN